MPRYFLCYRREDAAGHAGRLYADLVRAFGEEAVFFDLPSVPVGEDYREFVRSSIIASTVVVVVVGRQWRPELLHDADDDVRFEIETALAVGKRIVPVLVQGASMPKFDQLPEVIRVFARRNAAELSDRNWAADVKALIRALSGPAVGWRRRWIWPAIALLVGAIGVILGMSKVTSVGLSPSINERPTVGTFILGLFTVKPGTRIRVKTDRVSPNVVTYAAFLRRHTNSGQQLVSSWTPAALQSGAEAVVESNANGYDIFITGMSRGPGTIDVTFTIGNEQRKFSLDIHETTNHSLRLMIVE